MEPDIHPLQQILECCAIFREERQDEGWQWTLDTPNQIEEWERNCHDLRRQGVYRQGNALWYKGKAYVDASQHDFLVEEIHESKLGGHPGIAKTIAKVRQHYDFPELPKVAAEVVGKCHICKKAKASRHKPYGLLQPLPVAERPWSSLTMDFITKLPVSEDTTTGVKYDSILTVVDRLTKWTYFLPCKETWTAEQLADVIYRNVTSVHGWLEEWITDRDTKFVSRFWKALMTKLGVKSKPSSSNNIYGVTSISNKTIGLACYQSLNSRITPPSPRLRKSHRSSRTLVTKQTYARDQKSRYLGRQSRQSRCTLYTTG
ncbi:hypothetical protein VTI74DRAFT_2778 [Chaetomium olivicolor]